MILISEPILSYAQKNSLKNYDEENTYWVSLDDSLANKNKTESCNSYIRDSSRLMLVFTNTSKSKFTAEMRAPTNSKIWNSLDMQDMQKMHGEKYENELIKSEISKDKLQITYKYPNGKQNRSEYIAGETNNARYLIASYPGNSAINSEINEEKKSGKPGILEVKCKGPISK